MPEGYEYPDHVVVATLSDGHEQHLTDGHVALAAPQVILKIDGAYYVTFACWQYDPHRADLSKEEKKAIAEIEKLYEESGKVEARLLTDLILQPACSASLDRPHPRPGGHHRRCKPPGKPTRPHGAEHKIR